MFGYTERLGGRASGGGRRGPQMVYWPVARPFLLAGLVAVALVVALLRSESSATSSTGWGSARAPR